MKIRGHISAELTLAGRHAERIEALADRWRDEAAAAALAGNPRRAFYLEHLAGRVPMLAMGRDV